MDNEEALQLIWEHHLLRGKSLKTTCGLQVHVILPGERNPNAGPDFFNARISLGGLVWAGNVEIHHRASLWHHHGHHLDPAYDNVILHVVHHQDSAIKNSQGRVIPSLVVDPDKTRALMHSKVMAENDWPPSQCRVPSVSDEVLESWLAILAAKRLMRKTSEAVQMLTRFPQNKEKILFLTLASGFGLPINRLPFELMAARLPMPLVLDIKESLPHLEALFFCHSGLLIEGNNHDPYADLLLNNYKHLKKKYPEILYRPISGNSCAFGPPHFQP